MRTRQFPLAWAIACALFTATLASPAEATPKTTVKASSKETAREPKKKSSTASKPKPKAKGKAAGADRQSQPKAKAQAPSSKARTKSKAAPKAAKEAQPAKASPKKAAEPARAPRQKRTASTQTVAKPKGGARGKAKKPCFQPAVEVVRNLHRKETESFSLTFCDGKPAPKAIEELSILARPSGAPRPKRLPNQPAGKKGARGAKGAAKQAPGREEWSPNLKLVDEGLVTRLQKMVDHFKAKKITIVSGYRPESGRSYHQSAKALDFRIDGVKNEDLVAFCRGLPDTGCGYYPNSSFIHMDVRPAKTGHIYWIDASGPGEAPRYVSTWPLEEGQDDATASLDPAIAAAAMGESHDLPPLEEAPSLMEALGGGLLRPRAKVQPMPEGHEESL